MYNNGSLDILLVSQGGAVATGVTLRIQDILQGVIFSAPALFFDDSTAILVCDYCNTKYMYTVCIIKDTSQQGSLLLSHFDSMLIDSSTKGTSIKVTGWCLLINIHEILFGSFFT